MFQTLPPHQWIAQIYTTQIEKQTKTRQTVPGFYLAYWQHKHSLDHNSSRISTGAVPLLSNMAVKHRRPNFPFFDKSIDDLPYGALFF